MLFLGERLFCVRDRPNWEQREVALVQTEKNTTWEVVQSGRRSHSSARGTHLNVPFSFNCFHSILGYKLAFFFLNNGRVFIFSVIQCMVYCPFLWQCARHCSPYRTLDPFCSYYNLQKKWLLSVMRTLFMTPHLSVRPIIPDIFLLFLVSCSCFLACRCP